MGWWFSTVGAAGLFPFDGIGSNDRGICGEFGDSGPIQRTLYLLDEDRMIVDGVGAR